MSILDILGLVLIFLVILYIGWRATKKTKTSDDFLMANHSLGKIQAGFSMAAADIGGNAVVGAVAYSYAVGMGGVWYNWGAVIPMFLLAFVLAKQLRRISVSTVPELLGRRYSSATRLISVIAHLFAIGSSLGIQFTVAATTVSTIGNIDFRISLLITVAVVILYTSGGGLLAVANTDVFQFILIIISIAIIIPFGLMDIGGMDTLLQSVPDGFMNIASQGFLAPLSLGLLYTFDYATNQNILQRVFAARDSSTARFAFIFSSVTYVFFGLMVAFIGVMAFVLYPDLTDTQMAYSLILKDTLPSGVTGIALGGLFAAAMSTAAAKIMAASSLVVNDIYKPYFCKNKEPEDKHVLKLSRLVTAVVCVLGIGVTLVSDSLVQMMYVGGLFYGTAVFVPTMLAIYWKRGTAQAALAAIISSMAVGLYSEYFLSGQVQGLLGMPSNLLATLVGLAVFFVVSLVTPPPKESQLRVIEESKRMQS